MPRNVSTNSCAASTVTNENDVEPDRMELSTYRAENTDGQLEIPSTTLPIMLMSEGQLSSES